MEGVSSYGRPMSAAARAAVLRAKMAGAGIRVPSSAVPSLSSAEPTYLMALEKLTTTTEKWLESIEKLRETALKQQKRTRPEDPASGDERVHKTPLHKLAARKKLAEDVLKESSRAMADDDSGKSVGSNERIRPGTPTNMPRLVEPPPEPVSRDVKMKDSFSPPPPRIDELDIQSSKNAPVKTSADAMNIDSPTTAVSQNASPLLDVPKASYFRPPNTTQTSVASIPPTPRTLVTPPMVTPGEASSAKEPVLTAVPSSVVAPKPVSLRSQPSDSSLTLDPSAKSIDSVSTSSNKKRRLSAKTFLESLMEKKSRNPIYYDGEVQKIFTDMVFQMSQQIQSMKREARIVMFAKDPACRNLLVNQDNMLQKSLRTVEIASFLFLKGKPDLNQIEALKADLGKSLKEVAEFKNSGWTMASNEDEDSDSENDDDGSE